MGEYLHKYINIKAEELEMPLDRFTMLINLYFPSLSEYTIKYFAILYKTQEMKELFVNSEQNPQNTQDFLRYTKDNVNKFIKENGINMPIDNIDNKNDQATGTLFLTQISKAAIHYETEIKIALEKLVQY